MNKKSILYLILIVIVATLLRLWHLDKPEGMWNDEYLTWKIANAKLPTEFFYALKSNCHAPLHYLYLKLWMFIFHDSDKFLRLSSVIPGVLGVIVMYFAGREYKNKDGESTALTAAVLCAISSFLIYFSQEIRIYSLLFFITTLVLLYALKIFNNPSKKNFALYSLFSVLLILTHTIGFVFVVFSTAAIMTFAVSKKDKGNFALYSILGVVLLALPFVPMIVNILVKGSYFSQWWAPFNYSRTLFTITDIFSPFLCDTFHVYNTFADAFYKNNIVNLGFLVFAVIPALIGILCFINGALNPKRMQGYLLCTVACTVLTVLIAAVAGKIVFTTKYLIEIVPLVTLLAADGFASFKSKGFKIAIGTLFIVLNMFYFTVSNTSAVRLVREEGQRLPVLALSHMDIKKNDKIIFLYYPKEWYFKYIDFNNPENEPYKTAASINKYNYSAYFVGKNWWRGYLHKNGKKMFRPLFLSFVNEGFNSGLNKDAFNLLNKGDRLFIVDLTSVSFFPENVVKEIANNDIIYESTPLLYLAMSYAKAFTLNKAHNELSYMGYYNTGAWRVYVFKKA